MIYIVIIVLIGWVLGSVLMTAKEESIQCLGGSMLLGAMIMTPRCILFILTGS